MNDRDRIANHLNKLLHRATPYVWSDDGCYIDGGVKECDDALWQRIKPILDAAVDAVDKEEIAAAARERREADLVRPEVAPYCWRREIPWKASKALWAHCAHQIAAVIEAYNNERLAEYERYREACMQGVAVPPAE